MLNILFWNLKRHELENYIEECIVENNIDIAVFAEFEKIDWRMIEKNLGNMYQRVSVVQPDRKVTMIAKKTIYITVLQQEKRYNVYQVKTLFKDYLLAAIHLEDRRNYQTRDRLKTIEELVKNLEINEKMLKCSNTIIIGDFNANPYDEELLSKYAFNAVLFKKIIEKNELTNPETLKLKRFYNPIIQYISEDTEMYGSYYHDKESMTPYWHCLDQVLIRKCLVSNLSHVEYLKMINEKALLRNGIPNESVSDHLPLWVKFMEVGDGV